MTARQISATDCDTAVNTFGSFDPITYTGSLVGLPMNILLGRVYPGGTSNSYAGYIATVVDNDSAAVATINFGGVVAIDGLVNLLGASLTSIDFGAAEVLLATWGQASLQDVPALTEIIADSLVETASYFNITAPALTSLSLQSLEVIGTGANGLGGDLGLVETLNLPALISGGLGFTGNSLTSVSLPVYEDDHGAFPFVSSSLTTLSLPAIKYLRAGLPGIGDCFPAMVTFSLGAGLLLCGGDVIFTAAALSQASVDGILVSLAALDGTGGTTLFESQDVDLSGGTNASPGATGLAAKATLELRDCTVTVN